MAKKQKLFSIEDISITIGKSDPLVAIINVTGFSASAGWSNPELVALEKTLSADGILDLDFVAEPPSDFVAQVLTRMSANLVWKGDVERLIAVKVYSRSGSELEFVAGTEFEAQMADIAGFTPLPEPEPLPWWPQPRPWPFPFPIPRPRPPFPFPFPRPRPRPAFPPPFPWPKTLRIGEEGPPTLFNPRGESGPSTKALGEEGGKTIVGGEEGPKPFFGETDPRVDDPAGPIGSTGIAGEDLDVFDAGDFDPFGRR